MKCLVPPTIPGDTIQLGVEAIAPQPDGRILIGSRFEDFGTRPRLPGSAPARRLLGCHLPPDSRSDRLRDRTPGQRTPCRRWRFHQTILVNIPPDAPGEPDEHFVLSLGNPIGGILLGPTGNTTITLRDSLISPTPRFASVARFDADHLRLILSAPTGSTCILETSPALDSWTAIQTNVALNDTCLFEVSGLANSARRFFRARVP